MLDAHAQAYAAGSHSRSRLFLCGHLPMRRRCRMAGERFRVAQIHEALEELQCIVEAHAGLQAAADLEGHERAGFAAQVLLHERVIGIVGETRIVHRLDARIAVQELGNLAGVLDMPLDAQRQRLDALQQQKRIHRRKHGAHGALVHAAAAADEGRGAVMLGVNEAVVGRVGLREHGVARRIVGPREGAAVHDDAAQRGSMAAHEFRHRVDDDVRAVVDGPHQHRRRDGVVDDQWHAVAMRDGGERLEIAHIAGRITDGLAKNCAGIVVDQGLDIGRAVRLRETHLHSHPRQDVREEGVSRAVQLRHRHDVAPHFGGVQRRVIQRRLPRTHAEAAHSAFEFRDALLENVGGRVADPGVTVSRHFEVEQRGAMLGAVERVRGRLIDRHGDRFGGGIAVEAAVNCDCFSLHIRTLLWWTLF